MYKLSRLTVVLVLFLMSVVSCRAWGYSGGEGTAASPYEIANAADLIQLGNTTGDYGKYFKLTADIDMASAGVFTKAVIAGDTSVSSGFQGTVFVGNFNGEGHVISNLKVSGADCCGLFGYIGSGGIIANLGLRSVTIIGSGEKVGGLCGINSYGNITNSYTSGSVTGANYVGGLCGINTNTGSITSSFSSSDVVATGTIAYVGGLCGTNENSGSISRSYASGSVTGTSIYSYVGGLCGVNLYGNITGCYARGNIICSGTSSVGGMCGMSLGSMISGFWDVETSGIGVSGNNNYGAIGKTTVQMQTLSTFTDANWDFTADDGDAADWIELVGWYPVLAWENVNMVTVSDLAGIDADEARLQLEALGVEVQIVICNGEYPAGQVCGQSVIGEICSSGRVVLFESDGIKKYSGGGGLIELPYKIATASDLVALGNNVGDYGKYFILTADVDMANAGIFTKAVIASDADTDAEFDGTAFTGNFNGNRRVISNLNVSGKNFCGLFGKIDSGGVVANLGLSNVNINGSVDLVGGLCGWNCGGIITGCYASGIVTGNRNYVGGLCGQSNGSLIRSYASCAVTGMMSVGGLCGNNGGTITSCYARGTVTGNDGYVGGLCGWNDQGKIIGSYASCYMPLALISDGGLCGYNYTGIISGSYWNIETSGILKSDGGWGLTTSQMKQSASYYGWIDGSWAIDEGNDYPHLIWEGAAGAVMNNAYPVATYPGVGTRLSPFEIDSVDDLICLMYREDDQNKYLIMTADINLSGYTFNGAVLGYCNQFTGNFNGNGHVISNLTVAGIRNCGLFGQMGSGGVIANLGLENVNVTGLWEYIGSMCGRKLGGNITGSYATGAVTGRGNYVGGFCGDNYSGAMSGCYASVTVKGDRDCIGGLCGGGYGDITNSYATGTVTGKGSYIGGLTGRSYGKIISGYASGAVSGTGNYVGGLCGYNYSYYGITNSYASGSVSGTQYVGGLCGSNGGIITNTYARGHVSGTQYVGGLCGKNDYANTITGSFWDVQTSGIGVSGSNVSGAIGKTTSEMQTLSTFTAAGWDVSPVNIDGDVADWQIRSGSYPRLNWQLVAGDIAGAWGVDMADMEALTGDWLGSGIGDVNADGQTDMLDFAAMAKNWLVGN